MQSPDLIVFKQSSVNSQTKDPSSFTEDKKADHNTSTRRSFLQKKGLYRLHDLEISGFDNFDEFIMENSFNEDKNTGLI